MWDKPNYQKEKDQEVENMEAAYAELGKLVHRFFTGFHKDEKGGWPVVNVFLGTDYQSEADVNAQGFAIYKLFHTEEGDKLKLIADGKKISKVITKATKIFNCDHKYEGDTGWCKLCNVHRTVIE